MLGLVALAAWFLILWAENYSVADIAVPRFNLSKPMSIFVMSFAEFVTWTIWLVILLQVNLSPVILGVILFVLTHLHHTVQFCFFFPDGKFMVGIRQPMLIAASAIEAVSGQWLLVQVMQTPPSAMSLSTLILPLVGLILLFGLEHIVAGQVKPS